MPEWLAGLLVPVVGGAAVSIFVGLLGRHATVNLGKKIGGWLIKMLEIFDIPVISGDLETKAKYGFAKSIKDIAEGIMIKFEEYKANHPNP